MIGRDNYKMFLIYILFDLSVLIPPNTFHIILLIKCYSCYSQEHHIRTGQGSVSVIVCGDQDKPPLITYPDLALNRKCLELSVLLSRHLRCINMDTRHKSCDRLVCKYLGHEHGKDTFT